MELYYYLLFRLVHKFSAGSKIFLRLQKEFRGSNSCLKFYYSVFFTAGAPKHCTSLLHIVAVFQPHLLLEGGAGFTHTTELSSFSAVGTITTNCGHYTNVITALKAAIFMPSVEAVYILIDGNPDQSVTQIVSELSQWPHVPIHVVSCNHGDDRVVLVSYCHWKKISFLSTIIQ